VAAALLAMFARDVSLVSLGLNVRVEKLKNVRSACWNWKKLVMVGNSCSSEELFIGAKG
jgi:hypothetical protein